MFLFSNFILSSMLAILSWANVPQEGHSIEVKISNLKSNDGKLLIGLYNSEDAFLSTTFMSELGVISNKESSVVFKNVPSGSYAVSYVHDANDNDKMDTNFVGIPKEDYGCSNNATGFMGPPKWIDAKFELKSDKSIIIN